MEVKHAQSVPTKQRIAYGLPNLSLAVMGIPIFVYLPIFYTDVVGISATTVGLVIIGARAMDAITDPLMGYWSDRTNTRWGRRRPYLIWAALPLALCVYALFTPPVGGEMLSSIWFGAGIFVSFLLWTVVVVPYESLGPELTFDYNERITVLGIREWCLAAGTLLAACLPPFLGWAFGLDDSPAAERQKYEWFGLIYIPLIVGTCWYCAYFVREHYGKPSEHIPPLQAAIGQMLRNRPFRILLISYTISALGLTLPAILFPYYVTYYLGSANTDFFLIEYFAVYILSLPAWFWVAQRIGKKAAWLWAMIINTVPFACVLFISPGQEVIYGIIVFLAGLGGGAAIAIPPAMQADVIDYDEMLYGTRREGQFAGLWAISRKLAAALGGGVALPILDAVGYVPNQTQSPTVMTTLVVFYCAVPVGCNTIAIMLASKYPLGKKEHEEIRAKIEANRAATPPHSEGDSASDSASDPAPD